MLEALRIFDNSVRLDGGDHTARQALAQYEWSPRAKPVLTIRAVLRTIARAPLSLQKLTYDRAGGKVLYHTSYNPYFKHNTNLSSATDFIAHLTQFIPPWGVRYIHYYGLYSLYDVREPTETAVPFSGGHLVETARRGCSRQPEGP